MKVKSGQRIHRWKISRGQGIRPQGACGTLRIDRKLAIKSPGILPESCKIKAVGLCHHLFRSRLQLKAQKLPHGAPVAENGGQIQGIMIAQGHSRKNLFSQRDQRLHIMATVHKVSIHQHLSMRENPRKFGRTFQRAVDIGNQGKIPRRKNPVKSGP